MKHLSNLIALSLLLASNAAMAQEVSVDEAKSNALEFLSSKTAGTRRAKGQLVAQDLSLAYTSKSEAKTCFYVFNVGSDEGFVIAGGDESARQILGYCDHGTFDYDKAPDNFKWWLGQYTEQIKHTELDPNAAAEAPRRAKASFGYYDIGPLIKTKWEQGEPYNSEIPVYDSNGERYLTGCAATAMAQILNYWKYPEQGQGSHSYNMGGYEFSANFGETTYDWTNMRKNYDQQYTQKQAKAVGTLMYHAGVSVNMVYGTSESGASMDYVAPAFVNYFKYDKSIRWDERNYYKSSEWEKLIYDELNAGRPVLYCGTSDITSHFFICDGYDIENDMFTINWGWGGNYDGSFKLSGNNALYTPNYGNFNSFHKIIYNIQPAGMGTNIAIPHLVDCPPYTSPFEGDMYLYVDDNRYEYYTYSHTNGRLEDCYIESQLYNFCSSIDSYDLGIKLTETERGSTYFFTCYTNETILPVTSSQSSNNYRFYFNPFDIEFNGEYEIQPICRESGIEDAEWTNVDISYNLPILHVTGAKDPEPVDLDYTLESNIIQIGRLYEITPNPYYKGKITYTSSDPQVAYFMNENRGSFVGSSEGTITITAHSEATEYFKETTKVFEITVTKTIKKDVVFTIDENVLTPDYSTQISWSKDYNKIPVFSSNSSAVIVDETGLVTAVGNPGVYEITASAPETSFFNQTETKFTVIIADPDLNTIIEQPYFNNEDNAYKDDLVMHYKVLKSKGGVGPVNIYYSLEADNKTFTGKIETEEMALLDVYSGTYDFRYIDNCDITDYLTDGKKYTIHFYTSKSAILEYHYFPSVTFTYRDKLTVDYGVSSAGYGTLILPFNAELPEGMTIYSCPSVDENGVLTLVEESSIERNKPYIVKATYGENYHFEGPEAIDADKPSFQEGILVGAVGKNVTLQKNTDYILQVQDGKAAFYKYTGTKADEASENDSSGNRLAKQFRAFLRVDSSNNAPKFNLPGFSDEETNGISTITSDGHMPAGIYSIDGKRQSEFQKGLNILILEDGTAQKVFVK